jgi:uncharacterized membrane-anchored protein YjiN (DUF445 family)
MKQTLTTLPTAYSNYDSLGKQFKEQGMIVQKGVTMINKTLEDGTKKERKDVEDAMKKLEDKIKVIMNDSTIKEQKKIIENGAKERQRIMTVTGQKFFAEREAIMKDASLSQGQKQEKISKIFQKLQETFLTDEEKKFFKKMVHDNLVVIMPQRQLMGGGIAGYKNKPGSNNAGHQIMMH